MRSNQVVSRRNESTMPINTVLRNTYFLLSLTLIFSSFAAWYGMLYPATGGMLLVTFIAGFVLLFVTAALRNSPLGIVSVFAFTGCMGYSMGPMLNMYIKDYTNGDVLILTALGGTAAIFLASSAYVLVTRKDLSHLGKFLMTGLIVCIVAGIVNFFVKMPAIQLAISSMMVFISGMLMMYDTSRIIHNGESSYLMATISLYLDILMLFQNLLILLGAFGGRRN